jgi:hyperosmotically inducible protein
MMRTVMILWLALSLTGLLTACGTKDSRITERVRSRLECDPGVPAADIDVRTQDGVVTLSGQIVGRSVGEEAVKAARSVPGVTDVRSSLVIRPVLHSDNANWVVREDERAEKAEQKKEQRERAVKAPVTDASITTHVKDALLSDETTYALNIGVRTQNRVVTLEGRVNFDDEARKAIRIAQSVPGVKKVNSYLHVSEDGRS